MADDVPFTQEEINDLNTLLKLPPEQREKQLASFLKKLTPEQREFLKKQQSGGCPFCSIAEGKLASKKIYENDSFMAVLDIKPASRGHILLFPKKHYQLLAQMSEEEVSSLFTLANKLSAIVFECMKAEGTNIFTANGNAAGQMIPHVVVHIIPRWKDDKISFAWEGAKVDENEMNDIQQSISKIAQERLKENVQKIETVRSDDSFEEEERIP